MKSWLPSQFYQMRLTVCGAIGVTLLFILFTRHPALESPTNEKPVSFEPIVEPAWNQKHAPARPSGNLVIVRAPSSSDSDEELLRIARDLVVQSPSQAVAWAAALNDSLLRERFLFATLRAWGEKDPNTSVNWALNQDESWRFKRMEAVLAGVVNQPSVALEIGRRLLTDDPTSGSAYGTALIGALSAAGQFQAAVQFANEGPLDSRANWLNVTFTRWAQNQPEDAVKALDLIQDEPSRMQAFQSLANGWAANDPAALAGYAASLPDGANRNFALEKVVNNWSLQDPAGFAAWLNTSPPGVDFDRAIATLIQRTDGANRSSEIAMKWVENIGDPNLQHDSLLGVLKEWMQTNPAAAQQYVATAAWLDEARRQEILNSLRNPSPSIAITNDD